jgi:transcriptional regulator with XRE-family HTH domain
MNLERIIIAVQNLKGVKQTEIADKIGISRQALEYQMHKVSDPTLNLVEAIGRAYRINPLKLYSFLYKPLPEKRVRKVKKTYVPASKRKVKKPRLAKGIKTAMRYSKSPF